MDLEARVRSLFAAMTANDPEAILGHMAPGVAYQLEGRPAMDRERLAIHIREATASMAQVTFDLGAIVPKRNVTFVEWRARGELRDGRPFSDQGVHILSWDQDGRIAHATVHAASGRL